ncbi:hypothetical protein ElyMa_001510500 [Elysia marginata]|uniref:Uncharacterized protein n=1 Tax=Elysia marginata TaxID=1093978 RepID=A0AAV4J6N7_9GAST|nr:hypothetical protein ElyMa_001510500 [Elysia marginata]
MDARDGVRGSGWASTLQQGRGSHDTTGQKLPDGADSRDQLLLFLNGAVNLPLFTTKIPPWVLPLVTRFDQKSTCIDHAGPVVCMAFCVSSVQPFPAIKCPAIFLS